MGKIQKVYTKEFKEEAVRLVQTSGEQTRQALFEYLEMYYNRQRRHSTLGYVSPFVYEQMGRRSVEHNV